MWRGGVELAPGGPEVVAQTEVTTSSSMAAEVSFNFVFLACDSDDDSDDDNDDDSDDDD